MNNQLNQSIMTSINELYQLINIVYPKKHGEIDTSVEWQTRRKLQNSLWSISQLVK